MRGTKTKASGNRYLRIFHFLVDWTIGQGLIVALVSLMTAGAILWLDASEQSGLYSVRYLIYRLLMFGVAPLAIISLSAIHQQRTIRAISGIHITGWVRDTLLAGLASIIWFIVHIIPLNSVTSGAVTHPLIIFPTILFVVVLQWRRMLRSIAPVRHVYVHLLMGYTFIGSIAVFNSLPYIQDTLFFQILFVHLMLQAGLMLGVVLDH